MFRGTINPVTTVLFYLVIAAVIGLVVFFLAVLVFGRGEQMAPLDPRTSPAELPDHDINSDDVRKIRFALALRGYRMSDVDWTLERLGEQIDSLRLENAHLRGQVALPDTGLIEEVTVPNNPVSDASSPTPPGWATAGPTTSTAAGPITGGPGQATESNGALLTTSLSKSYPSTAASDESPDRPEHLTAHAAQPAADR